MIREDQRASEWGSDSMALISLGIGSVVFNLALLAWFGVRHGGDTERYLASAADLLSGRPFRGQGGWVYIGYNSLLALSDAAGFRQAGVIGFQVIVAALATLALYDLGRQLRGPLTGVLAAGFFIVNYDIARWHVYVLTDSLYISLVVLTTWLVHRAVGRGGAGHLAAAAVLLFTALIRPNGWMLIPVAATYWIARSGLRRQVKLRIAFVVVVVCVSGVLTITATQFGANAPPVRSPLGQEIDDLQLPFATVLTLRRALDPRWVVAQLFIELVHVRRAFSVAHNALIIATLAIVYPLAVRGFMRSRDQPLSRLMAAVVVGHLLIVAVTFRDRDGRYLLYVLPLLAVFAASGASQFARR